MESKVIIVIPTYNEIKNLPVLVEQIAALDLPNWQIIFVDDNSPDGTGKLADKLSGQYPIEVIHRQAKQGLGSAYRQGFELALLKQPDYIVQMDADLSHQSSDIIRLLSVLETADLAIGSRYIDKGGSQNWSWVRRMISQGANLMVRTILKSKIHDLTSGFKAFRADSLCQIDFKSTSSLGYNFQIEMNLLCEAAKLKIIEVPIIFIERQSGKSKFNFKIMFESANSVLALAWRRLFKK